MTIPVLEPIGLIAILRGLTPQEAPAIGEALYEAGLRRLEVPLNSPDPLDSIRVLASRMPADCRIGAGTVLRAEDVPRVRDAGGTMIIAPNTDTAVIAAAVEQGMESFPGVATATEAFAALGAGATALKIFPADVIGISGMKAWNAVVPAGTQFLPVGGVDASTLGPWLEAGAQGAGIGGSLYRPGTTPDAAASTARELMAVWTRAGGAPRTV